MELIHMPEAEYHASSGFGENQYITRSMIKAYDESPRGFQLRYVDKNPLAQFGGNKSTSLGSLTEAVINNTHEQFYCEEPIERTYPPAKGTAKRDSEEYSQYLKNKLDKENFKKQVEEYTAGREVIKSEEYAKVSLCIDSLNLNGFGNYILNTENIEYSPVIRWTDEDTGLRLQVMIDAVVEESILVDYKTGYKQPSKFLSSAVEYGYDLQAYLYSKAYYLATGEELPFVFAYMQTVFPFEADVIQLNDEILEVSRQRVNAALIGIAEMVSGPECEQSTGATILEAPEWYTSKFGGEE